MNNSPILLRVLNQTILVTNYLVTLRITLLSSSKKSICITLLYFLCFALCFVCPVICIAPPNVYYCSCIVYKCMAHCHWVETQLQ